MISSPELTQASREHLDALHALLPQIEPPFLVETALALTRSLYEKANEGGSFTVTYPDGKSEELRFKLKKPTKAKAKKTESSIGE